MPGHRLTIRLDDEVWDALEAVCDVAGVSATSLIQANITVWAQKFAAMGWEPPTAWPDGTPNREGWMGTIETARRIDRERRRRRAQQIAAAADDGNNPME